MVLVGLVNLKGIFSSSQQVLSLRAIVALPGDQSRVQPMHALSLPCSVYLKLLIVVESVMSTSVEGKNDEIAKGESR